MIKNSVLPTILAIDCGTSTFKMGLIDSSGKLLWQARKFYSVNPQNIQWSSGLWIISLKELVSEFRIAQAERAEVMVWAVVISGQGPSPVLLSKGYADNRESSYRVLHWINSENKSTIGEKSLYLPQIQYFRFHNPQEFARVERILPCAEYLSWLLCGSEAVFSPNEDFKEFVWTDKGVRAYDLPSRLFPQWKKMGAIIGQIDSKGAEMSGLQEGIPVIAGGTDFHLALIGTGVLNEGMCCNRAGSSEGINYCSKETNCGEHAFTVPHVRKDYFNIAINCGLTGLHIDRLKKNDTYHELFRKIDESMLFPQIFMLRHAYERLIDQGAKIDAIRICGGQALSDRLTQIRANILGVAFEVPHIIDSELLGSAIIGFLGLSVYKSLKYAVENCVVIKNTFVPNPAKKYNEEYRKWLVQYKKIYDTMNDRQGF